MSTNTDENWLKNYFNFEGRKKTCRSCMKAFANPSRQRMSYHLEKCIAFQNNQNGITSTSIPSITTTPVNCNPPEVFTPITCNILETSQITPSDENWLRKYFRYEGRKKTCLSCLKVFANPSRQRMSYHLDKCHLVPKNQKETISTLQKIDKRRWILSQKESEEANKELTLALITSGIPLNFLNNIHLKNTFKMINEKYKPATISHVSEHIIPEIYEKMKNDLEKELNTAKSVTIAANGWWDTNNRFFIHVLVYTPRPFLYEFKDVTETSQNGVNVSNIIEDIFLKINPYKIAAFINDNESYMQSTLDMISDKYPWIISTSCKSNEIDLLVKEILQIDEFYEIIESCKTIVSLFKQERTNVELTNAKILTNLTEKNLKDQTSSCWNSIYNMINSILMLKDAIIIASYSSEIENFHDVKSIIQDNNFWKVMTGIKTIITPLASVTDSIQKDDNNYLTKHEKMIEALNECKTITRSSDISKIHKDKVISIIEYREQLMNNNIPLLFQILNPSSRGENLSPENRNKLLYYIRTKIDCNSIYDNELYKEITDWLTKNNDYKPTYIGDQSLPWIDIEIATKDIKKWFSLYFPNKKITTFLHALYSIPYSSASIEKNWSIENYLRVKQKNMLSDVEAERMTFIDFNSRNVTKEIITENRFDSSVEVENTDEEDIDQEEDVNMTIEYMDEKKPFL